MSTFGSTQAETDVPDEGMKIASEVRRKTATLGGLSQEMQIQKQQIAHLSTRLDSVVGLYQTLLGMYDTLQRQRAIELNAQVNHGPTS